MTEFLQVPKTQIDTLASEVQAVSERQQQAEMATSLRQEDLARLGTAADEVPDLQQADAALESALNEANESSRQDREEIGSLRHQLSSDDENRAAAGILNDEIQEQGETLHAWEEVDVAIGSRNGDKFRNFAQSITLEQLVRVANRDLESIAPRYRLAKGGDNNLDLHVVDCDMEEERRSARSLSGGERFLVSLALALALSSLNGRQSFVDTLFIDEGFGALDSEALDTAIGALEKIQSFGRKVGVITHVDGIKERVPVQVVVEKLGAGRSRIRLSPAA